MNTNLRQHKHAAVRFASALFPLSNMAPAQATAAAIGFAVTACPFLARVAETSGHETAARIAVAPLRPATAARGPVALEPTALDSLLASFKLMHGGTAAPLPLGGARSASAAAAMACPHAAAARAARCPHAGAATAVPGDGQRHAPALPPRRAAATVAPQFASISFSLFGGLVRFLGGWRGSGTGSGAGRPRV